MRNFKSKFAPVIKEYLEHRKTLGYSDNHEKTLSKFDNYCNEYHSDLEILTKNLVSGWVNYEISRGYSGLYGEISAVRMFAQYMGNGSYVLPITAVPKRPVSVPYIMTDDELARLFIAANNIKGNTDSTIKRMFPTLLRLMYTCGLRPNEVRLIK